MLSLAKKLTPRPIKQGIKKTLRALSLYPPEAPAAQEPSYPWAHIPYDPNRVPDEAYSRHFPEASLQERHFYNIGAGSFRHKYWTNVDYASDWYAGQQEGTVFINHDLLTLAPLPIANSVAEAVYTSHTVEHITDEAVAVMLSEACRILKPGGCFRITTPDIDLHYAAWQTDDVDFYYWRELYSHPDLCAKLRLNPARDYPLGQQFLFNFATHVSELVNTNTLAKISTVELARLFAEHPYEEALNICAARCPIEEQQKNPGFHINWWNEAKLRRMLAEAGFTVIYKSGYGQSLCPPMRDVMLFDQQDPKISIYMEARK